MQAHIFPPRGVVGIKPAVAAALSGQVGDQVGAAGGHTQAIGNPDVMILQVVVYTGGVDATHSAAHINDTDHKTQPPCLIK